jgi:two-component system OmpR family response regulator
MKRILIVEDDPAMGSQIERGLVEEGYAVTRVADGVSALIAIATGDFAAATVDVMLPKMSGLEICRQLRRQGNTLPVLLLTARDAVEDRVRGLDDGADDYLTKPFAWVEFSARIRALVRRDATTPKLALRLGTIELDTATIRATVDGRPLAFSSKEFSLLRLLMAHAGDVLSREAILQEVWGTARHIDPTIVDQYVRYLRRKLEPAASGVVIETVRGIGYRIRERA